MHARTIEGTVLELGLEGTLFRGSMVLNDPSGTLWVQATGAAIKGPLKGRRLEQLPATLARWSAWKAAEPATVVIDARAKHAERAASRLFRDDRDGGLGLAVSVGRTVKLYPFEALRERLVVEDLVEGRPVAIVYSRARRIARAYDRTEGGRVRVLEPTCADDAVFDLREVGTETTFDPVSGRARAAAEVPPLAPLPSHWIRQRAFKQHFPNGEIYAPPKPPPGGGGAPERRDG